MPQAVGITFHKVAKSYWFSPGDLELHEMDRVMVETARGIEIGRVRVPPREIPEEELISLLKPVLRLADDADIRQEFKNREKAALVLEQCRDAIRRLELPMKLLSAEYSFDTSHITVFFIAEGRVDFRELVKEMAGQLRCKVQLHQVGARDQAKMIGGVGPCGVTLCCATYLTEFAPISMKMAKDQSLFLNPVKFSGVCGKLMCCLRYEHDYYMEAKDRLPQMGDIVQTPRGEGRVQEVNIIKEDATVLLSENQVELSFSCKELVIIRSGHCSGCHNSEEDNLVE